VVPRPDLLSPAVPELSTTAGPLAGVLADVDDGAAVLALAVGGDGLEPGRPVDGALAALGLERAALVATHEPRAEAGAVVRVPLPPGGQPVRTLLLVAVGAATGADLRQAGAGLARAVKGGSTLVTTLGGPAALTSAFVEGLVLGGYTVPRWGAGAPAASSAPVARVVLVGRHQPVHVGRGSALAGATLLARNLANAPSNIKTPAWMAAQSRTVARRSGLAVRVWSEADLRREGFGGLLAVGGGSVAAPRLVQLGYQPGPAGRHTPHVVLVGKGITFDTGGLDIKAPEAMRLMKTDMSGAAVVLAVLAACRDLRVAVQVTGLLALAENAVSGSSYRPGDVVTQYGGTTVEIGNTDAEGRIVLADALAYADARLAPDVLIDVATLTGASTTALGRAAAAGYATDSALERALGAAGDSTGEPVWPFPLFDGYRGALDSDVADLNHVAGPGFGAGSIVAALFLREFVGGRPWAHLDIAGPARSERDSGILTRGPTGFGARLLLSYLSAAADAPVRGRDHPA